ncbi:MAG: VOC family protein [Hyphomicrobiales bacterium]|nr:VOC family protein [Hyphomicrobiales bacterium]
MSKSETPNSETVKPKATVFDDLPVRPIDHIVISLPDLDLARRRFTELGFNVNPVARHNFGTENTIIPFSNGTFIEPLGIGDAADVKKFTKKRNQFLVRDQAYRYRHSIEEFSGGFSMLAFCGENAKRDRKNFRKAGLHTGKIARVKRPGLDIRSTFAMDERASDCTLFVCERKDGIPEFDSDQTNHPNGALRISRIVLVDDNPADFLYYVEVVSGQSEFEKIENGMNITLPNGLISVVSPKGLKSEYGMDIPNSSLRNGPRLITYDIAVRLIDETAMMLAEKGIKARQVGERIVVANAPGQGATLAFVEDELS